MDASEQNYVEKRLLKMFLTADEVLMGVKILIKIYQCEIFNFVHLCSGVGIVWSTTTRTRINDATAVTHVCYSLIISFYYPPFAP